MQIRDAVELIQMEYAECPELSLTLCQARCLWGFSDELCERALAALIGSGFLARTPEGAFVRRSARTGADGDRTASGCGQGQNRSALT
jgi:hypothetical protein